MKLKDIVVGEHYAVNICGPRQLKERVVVATGHFADISGTWSWSQRRMDAREAGEPTPEHIDEHESHRKAVVVDMPAEMKGQRGITRDTREVVPAQSVRMLWTDYQAERAYQEACDKLAIEQRLARSSELDAVFAEGAQHAAQLRLPTLEAAYEALRAYNAGPKLTRHTKGVDLEALATELEAIVALIRTTCDQCPALDTDT